MARDVERPSSGLVTRLAVGALALVVVWLLLGMILGTVFALIRTALFVGLFAVVAWVVLIGPPDLGRKR